MVTVFIFPLMTVKALNQARFEANVRAYGGTSYQKKWPSPYAMACGVLLAISILKYVYHPLRWFALGAVAIGIFPIILKGLAAIRNFKLDINILVLIAGKSDSFFLLFSFRLGILYIKNMESNLTFVWSIVKNISLKFIK